MKMKEVNNDIDTIVLVGAWNLAIFSDEWVRKNILDEDQSVNILFPNVPNHSLKFVFDDFSFYIAGSKLCFELNEYTEKSGSNAVRTCRKILQTLPHTPVHSFGINFIYDGESQPADRDTYTKRLVEFLDSSLVMKSEQRSFKLSENLVLNFTIANYSNGGCRYNFNYDYTVNGATDIMNAFGDSDDIVDKLHAESMNLLEEIN